MRAIWKGAVAFGLVNVPVRLYAATGEHDVPLHQVHAADGGRIRYRRFCSVEDRQVDQSEIAKGYQTEDGRMVVLTDEDLARLPLTSEREIEVLEFVPADQVDPILLAKTYYLEPDRTAAKPYALLRQALAATDRMAVVKVALRQRESMAVLRVRDDVICLQTLLWPDEVREADFPVLDTEVQVRPQELAMASSLVEQLVGDFDPSGFEDRYQAALEAAIEEKITVGAVQEAPAAAEDTGPGEGGQVVDLLAALQRSVDRARAGRNAATDDHADRADEDAGETRATGTDSPRPGTGSGSGSGSGSAKRRTTGSDDPAPARRRPKSASDAGSGKTPRRAAAKPTTTPAERSTRPATQAS